MRADQPNTTHDELAQLAALADGSLSPERRAEVEKRVAASPELQTLLEEQRRAVATVRRTDPAPARLRAKIDAQRLRPVRRRRLPLVAGACASAAALVLALILTGGGEPPSIADAAALATKPATARAPGPYDESTTLLALEVEDVPYPNWSHRFGWQATGTRTDRIRGREAKTVFYEKRGRRIGYTIVTGGALRKPAAGARVVRQGTELRTLDLAGRTVVTWRRRGHTCVLSGADVGRTTLLTLGSWRGKGSVPY